MTLITKLTQLFSKTASMDSLGICLQGTGLGYCLLPNKTENSHTQSETSSDNSLYRKSIVSNMPLIKGGAVSTLAQLLNQDNIQGQCQLVLQTGQYHLVQINKPEVPVAELHSALRWQIKELVPISPENMVLDYFQGPNINGNEQKINVVCASKSELQAMVSQFEQDACQLTAITIPEFAFANLLPYSDDAVLMVCQQPEEELFILVVRQGRILFYRHLRGFVQVANKSEQELSFGVIDSLSLEIQKSSDYFERQLKQAAISAIVVLAPGINEAYLASKLADNTNVPLTLLSLPDGVENKRNMAAAIGVTMPQKVAS